MKTHYYDGNKNACGQPVSMRPDRSLRINTNTFEVDCGSCILRNSFQEAHQKAVLKKERQFMEQIPRQIREPWREGNIECRSCGSNFFRVGDRTCYGHYDNFHCSNCGHVESRLTETGMSF